MSTFDDDAYDFEDWRGYIGAVYDQDEAIETALAANVSELDISEAVNLLRENTNQAPYVGPIYNTPQFETKEK